jgi:hypothetical protein
MPLQRRKPETPSSEPQKERNMRQAVDADKSEDNDRDLVHEDGGTLGLGRPETLNRDD